MSDVRLVEADYGDKALVRNLMQFYLYEMSAFDGSSPNRHGVFEYPRLDQYWTEEGGEDGRVPFMIGVDGTTVDFALRNRWSVVEQAGTACTVAEFFVLRTWRRQGVGRAAATSLFDRFSGPWEMRELRANLPAQCFWRSVISAYTGGMLWGIDVWNDAWDGPVQTFTANSPSS